MGFFRRRPTPPSDIAELATWMADETAQGNYARVWHHRFELGLGFEQGAASDRDWFWVNAYPALAALRLEADPSARHPLVSTCAGYADQVHRSLGDAERAANAEIAQRFFGS